MNFYIRRKENKELQNEKARESITGNFIRKIHRDYQNGYTVFSVKTEKEIITCTGNIILPSVNMKIEVTGVWGDESKWGKQLTDCTIKEIFTDKIAMVEYLRNIPNVGLKTAQDLVETFGEKIYEIASGENAKQKLKIVSSVTDKRAESIINYIQTTREWRKFFELIVRHGGTYNAAYKVYKEHGINVINHFLENPYLVGIRAGLSFEICDSIACENGMNPYNNKRILAAIIQILKKGATAGNSYLDYADIIELTRKKLNLTEFDEPIATACINATINTCREGIIQEDGCVYLSYIYHHEINVAKAVKRLINGAKPSDIDVEELIAHAEKVCSVEYADQQRDAFNLIRNGGLGIVTGGPGTGKTTVIKGLIAAFQYLYPEKNILLCAPTGRASQRMKEATKREASTIHRLLEFKPIGDGIAATKNITDPLEADCLICDEMSMADIPISDFLLQAVLTGTAVILTGDVDQLPAVGAGNVLCDLIQSGVVPTVALVKTYRQAEDSNIIKNAHRVKDGFLKLNKGDDFEIIEVNDDSKIPEITRQVYEKYNEIDDVFAAQILCPARRERATASNELNKLIQSVVNQSSTQMKFGNTAFRINDKVMFMRNNYSSNYFNGDVGIITDIRQEQIHITVDGQELVLEAEMLEDLSLAYATTIHKSQGSEYKTVIIALPSEPSTMLQMNLLYTAITRAKKQVILIATKGSIEKSIKSRDATKRKSKLAERLRA